MKAKHVETYAFDWVLQCRDCNTLDGVVCRGMTEAGGFIDAHRVTNPGHTVEVIETRVRAYGDPDASRFRKYVR